MFPSDLAFFAVTYASVMSMAFGSLLLIMYRGGVRISGMRLLAFSWYLFCIYFFILATTAGKHPIIDRAQVAAVSRILLILTFTTFGIAYLSIFRAFAQANDRRRWLW